MVQLLLFLSFGKRFVHGFFFLSLMEKTWVLVLRYDYVERLSSLNACERVLMSLGRSGARGFYN